MELTPQQVADRLDGASLTVQVVDVREAPELAAGMIPGARHVPLAELPDKLGTLDKSLPVIAVCRSGRRSASAAERLAAAGFTAYTMSGGMLEWQAAGLPTT